MNIGTVPVQVHTGNIGSLHCTKANTDILSGKGGEGFVYVPVDYNRLLGHSQTYCIFTDTIPGTYVVEANIDIKGTMGQNME